MRNPYVVGSIVRHPYFYGRQGLAEDLLDERHQCIYLIGNRRIGKTSLLNHLQIQSLDVALFLNLQATEGDPLKMGAKLVRQIKRKMKDAPILQNVRLETGAGICDVVETLSETAEDIGFRVLLLWDEGEELLSLDKDSLKRLRAALQDVKNIRTVLTATKRLSELNDRGRSWQTSPFLHGFTARYIPPLQDQEAAELICQINNPEGAVQASQELQSQIMRVTGNHPYLIQHLCYRLFESAGKLRAIEERDFIVDDQLSAFFQIDYEALSHSERAIMRALSEQDSLSESQVYQALKINRHRLRSHLTSLEQLGYVSRSADQYQIANRFLCTWLNMGRATETPEVVSDEASLEVSNMVSNPVSSTAQPAAMTFRERADLVSALLRCAAMSHRGARDRVVNDLPDDMRSRIQRNSIDRVDVANIVSACSDFADGIQKLVEIVHFYEGESSAMQNVKAATWT